MAKKLHAAVLLLLILQYVQEKWLIFEMMVSLVEGRKVGQVQGALQQHQADRHHDPGSRSRSNF